MIFLGVQEYKVLLYIGGIQCWTEGQSSTAVAEDLRPTATVAEV